VIPKKIFVIYIKMSFNSASAENNSTKAFHSLTLIAGLEATLENKNRNVDLNVRGSGVFNKNLIVCGNIDAESLIKGSMFGNIMTNNITTGDMMQGISIVGNLEMDEEFCIKATDIIPSGSDQYCLGTDTQEWSKMYTKDLFVSGNIFGNITNVTVAGNLIETDIVCADIEVQTPSVTSKSGTSGPLELCGNIVMKGPGVNVQSDAFNVGNIRIGGDIVSECGVMQHYSWRSLLGNKFSGNSTVDSVPFVEGSPTSPVGFELAVLPPSPTKGLHQIDLSAGKYLVITQHTIDITLKDYFYRDNNPVHGIVNVSAGMSNVTVTVDQTPGTPESWGESANTIVHLTPICQNLATSNVNACWDGVVGFGASGYDYTFYFNPTPVADMKLQYMITHDAPFLAPNQCPLNSSVQYIVTPQDSSQPLPGPLYRGAPAVSRDIVSYSSHNNGSLLDTSLVRTLVHMTVLDEPVDFTLAYQGIFYTESANSFQTFSGTGPNDQKGLARDVPIYSVGLDTSSGGFELIYKIGENLNGDSIISQDVPRGRAMTRPFGFVDKEDLVNVLNAWGPCTQTLYNGNCWQDIADGSGLTPDGQINAFDLFQVLAAFGYDPSAVTE
jgi:hypothetical protein